MAGASRSTRTAARQWGLSEKLLYRRQQQQQAATGLGSAELACDPEVRALLAELARVQRERDILKKPWPSSAARRRELLPLH